MSYGFYFAIIFCGWIGTKWEKGMSMSKDSSEKNNMTKMNLTLTLKH